MARALALPSGVRRRFSSPAARHLLLALLALVVMLVVLTNISSYRAGQLASLAYLGVAAGGLTVLTGLSGQLSLGHGAFMAIGAYTAALMLQEGQGAPPLLLVLLAATVVSLVVGAVVGVAAARLHGPYIAGATLALAIAVPGLAIFFGSVLGGEQGLTLSPPAVPDWFGNAVYFVTARDIDQNTYLSIVCWLCLIGTYLLLANLGSSRAGRRWRAVRDDEVAAEIAGINLSRARVSAFVVSTACAGLAGALMALVVRIAAPSGFTLVLSLVLLSAVVLGGLGSLLGAALGAALLTFLPQLVSRLGQGAGLSDIRSAQLTPLLYGLTMVLVILLAPAGLVGSLRRLGGLRQRVTARDTPVSSPDLEPPSASSTTPNRRAEP